MNETPNPDTDLTALAEAVGVYRPTGNRAHIAVDATIAVGALTLTGIVVALMLLHLIVSGTALIGW